MQLPMQRATAEYRQQPPPGRRDRNGDGNAGNTQADCDRPAELGGHIKCVNTHPGGEQHAERMVGPQLGYVLRAAARQLRPIRMHRHRAVLGPSSAQRAGHTYPVGTTWIAPGNHRPAVAGEADGLRPKLGAEGVSPGVRPVHLASIAVAASLTVTQQPLRTALVAQIAWRRWSAVLLR